MKKNKTYLLATLFVCGATFDAGAITGASAERLRKIMGTTPATNVMAAITDQEMATINGAGSLPQMKAKAAEVIAAVEKRLAAEKAAATQRAATVTASAPPPSLPAASIPIAGARPMETLPNIDDAADSDDEVEMLAVLERRKQEIARRKAQRAKAHNASIWRGIREESPPVLHPLIDALEAGKLSTIAIWLNRTLPDLPKGAESHRKDEKIEAFTKSEMGNYLLFLYYLSSKNLMFASASDQSSLIDALKSASVEYTRRQLDGLFFDIGRIYHNPHEELSPRKFKYEDYIKNPYAPPSRPTGDTLDTDHTGAATVAIAGAALSVGALRKKFSDQPVMGATRPLTAAERRNKDALDAVRRMHDERKAAPPPAHGNGMNLPADRGAALKVLREAVAGSDTDNNSDDGWSDDDDSDNEPGAGAAAAAHPAAAANDGGAQAGNAQAVTAGGAAKPHTAANAGAAQAATAGGAKGIGGLSNNDFLAAIKAKKAAIKAKKQHQ